jgi:hypothetical protein
MIVKINEIKGENVQDVIKELENRPEIMDFCRGYNLSSDVLEAMANDLVNTDNDIDTDNYRNDD